MDKSCQKSLTHVWLVRIEWGDKTSNGMWLVFALVSSWAACVAATQSAMPTMQESTEVRTPSLTVKRIELPRSSGRSPRDVLLAPQEAGSYPVMVFHHGTSLLASDYVELLTEVARAGAIIFAPQLYSPLALVTTSVQKEQDRAMESQRWAVSKLRDFLPEVVLPDTDHGIIIAGHSRGGAVAFLCLQRSLENDPPVRGIILLDPVDTKQVPVSWLRKAALPSDQAGYTTTPSRWPSLVFGTGLGSQTPACAPNGSAKLP